VTEERQVTIEAIDDKSPHLESIIALGDAHKATLGFLPKGAFLEHAARRQILVALQHQTGCIGYLLYGSSRSHNRITIIHLCISSSHRGKGVARKLFNYLTQITQESSGIGLTCRRDYQLDNMWSGFGFVPQSYKPAKTAQKELTYWWLDHGYPNLFSNAATQQRESKLCVIIDPDIFFELYTSETITSEESQSLLADWLEPELDLCVTNEIFNRINDISNISERKRQHNLAKKFTCLPCQNQRVDASYQSLQTLFFNQKIAIDESNLRNLARTIASDVHILVTHNSCLLDIADNIYENFRLSILRPTDLIANLYELHKNHEYQPICLAGTLLEQVRIQRGKESILYEHFNADQQGETKAEFQQKLRRFLAEPDKFECFIVLEEKKQPLALVVYDRHKRHELDIPMIRVGENPLGATIGHHLIFQATLLSAREQRNFTRISDPHLQEGVTRAIQRDNTFVNVKDGYLRANIAVAETAFQLSQRLTNLANDFGSEYDFCQKIANLLKTEGATLDIKTMFDIERHLYPAKILDANIPTFMIPIHPFWAHNLFDAKLARQTLIGATKTELALNREAVYYKSKNAPKELRPDVKGRILWYVTDDHDHGYQGVSAVRACSRFDEVVIGKPKDLYLRFRNLGIFEWKNVFNIAQNKLDNDIMAIRFSDPELFSNPIQLKKIQEILGKKAMQGSCYISQEKFAKIYTLGTHT